MSLPEYSIQRSVSIAVYTLLALLLGGIAFVKIPIDLMPDTVYPTISVRAEYPGVAPEEMENLVARPLEEAFASAPGVEEITSTSSEGASFVRVNFAYGMNLDEAANELRARLDRRRQTLPEDMDPPTMFKYDVSQFPIMFLTIATEGMNSQELRHFVEKQIQYRLERVPGVAAFSVRGGLRREIHVDLDLAKLRALDLSVAQVVDIVRRENLNRPVGPVQEGRFEVLLRTQGEFQDLEQIRGLVVASRQSVPVYMRDIATVVDSHEEIRQMVSVNGQTAVRLFVYKQAGANTVMVCDGVWEEVDRIHADYPGISITATGDASKFIRAAIDNVKGAAWQGSLLAILVLLFFLRSFSSALVIGVAIPISVIATFALMYFCGFTLNTVSFGGLALGVGMLVDNAIVVLENIARHRENGEGPVEAAVLGSKEVAMAITASTLTTVAVFVPVLFISGISAVTFQQLAYVVSFSLFCSLAVALTVVPVLCSKYLRSGGEQAKQAGFFGRLFGRSADAVDAVARQYAELIGWAVNHRATVVLTGLVLFAGSIALIPYVAVELQPAVDEGEVRVSVELEPGTRVEITDGIIQRMSGIVRDNVPEIDNIMVESGGGGFMTATGQHMGEMRVRLVERNLRSRSVHEIANAIRPLMEVEPGMAVRTTISGGMYMRSSRTGFSEGDRLQVEIRGHELDILERLAHQVQDAMRSIPGVPDAQISRRPGAPEMLILVDRQKASSMGLNVSDIADTFETAIGGRRTSMFRQGGDEYNILVRLREEDRIELGQVGSVPLTTPTGKMIPAESVIRMKRQEGPTQIDRADQERLIVVSGTLADRDLGSVMTDLQASLADIPRPAGYEIRFGGEYEEQQEAFRDLTFAAILALVLVYMVMATQFQSWRDPLVVIFSVPLAAIGVVGILLLTGTTFNMQAFLGVIILVGIVVNNAIILVDYANQLRREHGYGVRDAVITAGHRRLRPILMTTITTVLGLIPMALGMGEGSELQAPLALSIIGGLTTSTLITLVVIPVVYASLEERAARIRERRGLVTTTPLLETAAEYRR